MASCFDMALKNHVPLVDLSNILEAIIKKGLKDLAMVNKNEQSPFISKNQLMNALYTIRISFSRFLVLYRWFQMNSRKEIRGKQGSAIQDEFTLTTSFLSDLSSLLAKIRTKPIQKFNFQQNLFLSDYFGKASDFILCLMQQNIPPRITKISSNGSVLTAVAPGKYSFSLRVLIKRQKSQFDNVSVAPTFHLVSYNIMWGSSYRNNKESLKGITKLLREKMKKSSNIFYTLDSVLNFYYVCGLTLQFVEIANSITKRMNCSIINKKGQILFSFKNKTGSNEIFKLSQSENGISFFSFNKYRTLPSSGNEKVRFYKAFTDKVDEIFVENCLNEAYQIVKYNRLCVIRERLAKACGEFFAIVKVKIIDEKIVSVDLFNEIPLLTVKFDYNDDIIISNECVAKMDSKVAQRIVCDDNSYDFDFMQETMGAFITASFFGLVLEPSVSSLGQNIPLFDSEAPPIFTFADKKGGLKLRESFGHIQVTLVEEGKENITKGGCVPLKDYDFYKVVEMTKEVRLMFIMRGIKKDINENNSNAKCNISKHKIYIANEHFKSVIIELNKYGCMFFDFCAPQQALSNAEKFSFRFGSFFSNIARFFIFLAAEVLEMINWQSYAEVSRMFQNNFVLSVYGPMYGIFKFKESILPSLEISLTNIKWNYDKYKKENLYSLETFNSPSIRTTFMHENFTRNRNGNQKIGATNKSFFIPFLNKSLIPLQVFKDVFLSDPNTEWKASMLQNISSIFLIYKGMTLNIKYDTADMFQVTIPIGGTSAFLKVPLVKWYNKKSRNTHIQFSISYKYFMQMKSDIEEFSLDLDELKSYGRPTYANGQVLVMPDSSKCPWARPQSTLTDSGIELMIRDINRTINVKNINTLMSSSFNNRAMRGLASLVFEITKVASRDFGIEAIMFINQILGLNKFTSKIEKSIKVEHNVTDAELCVDFIENTFKSTIYIQNAGQNFILCNICEQGNWIFNSPTQKESMVSYYT